MTRFAKTALAAALLLSPSALAVSHASDYTLEIFATDSKTYYYVAEQGGATARETGAWSSEDESAFLKGDYVRALIDQRVADLPQGDGEPVFGFSAFGVSFSLDAADLGHSDNAQIRIKAGDKETIVNANDRYDGHDEAHIRIVGADQEDVLDFIEDAELDVEVRNRMRATLGLED